MPASHARGWPRTCPSCSSAEGQGCRCAAASVLPLFPLPAAFNIDALRTPWHATMPNPSPSRLVPTSQARALLATAKAALALCEPGELRTSPDAVLVPLAAAVTSAAVADDLQLQAEVRLVVCLESSAPGSHLQFAQSANHLLMTALACSCLQAHELTAAVYNETGDAAKRDAAAAQWAACTAAGEAARRVDEISGSSTARGTGANALAALWGLSSTLAL